MRAETFEDRIFPIVLVVTGSFFAIAIAGLYWYFTPQLREVTPHTQELSLPKREFGDVYRQLGFDSLPAQVESRPQVQNRLDQLSREPCYLDAIVALADVLLEAGYPRESVTSLRSFAKRCDHALTVLPRAYNTLEHISDFSGALEVASELVEAAPANGDVRYWRAKAYEKTGDISPAQTDYINAIQLAPDPKIVRRDVFYDLSRTYDRLGRPCDAITPLETYVSLDPSTRRTPQIMKVISDYAAKGNCDTKYASGTARVPFARTTDIRTLIVFVNGAAGTFILDTGATLVSVTRPFAAKAPSPQNRETLQSSRLLVVPCCRISDMRVQLASAKPKHPVWSLLSFSPMTILLVADWTDYLE